MSGDAPPWDLAVEKWLGDKTPENARAASDALLRLAGEQEEVPF